ncbi:MAG: hypothetical protein QOE45_2001 [Frankiaceae bacterium]|jgi:integrase|nr:hypothetical protein [Frankiaceae bacterium]
MARRDKDGRWIAEWRVGYGRDAPRRTRRMPTRASAVALEERMRDAQRRGEYVDPADGRTTFESYARAWLAGRKVRPGTLAVYRHALEHNVIPAFGHLPLASIRAGHLDDLDRSMTHLAPATRRQRMLVAAMVLKRATRDRLIPVNPMNDVELPEVGPSRNFRCLTSDQLDALLTHAGPAAGMVALGAGAGARQGEGLGMTVERVRFLRREVEYVDQGPGRPLKTAASRDSVPVQQWVLDALADACTGRAGTDFLFTTPTGRQWSRGRWNLDVWKPALLRAGLDPTLGFHVLRHTYATLLIAADLHPRIVQARMRHASITETMGTYGHLFPEAAEETRRAMDALFTRHSEERKTRQGRGHPL